MIKSRAANISSVEKWMMASRPKTLLAAFVPVIIGSSLAVADGVFNPAAAFIALLCSALIQIGTNFVNDLYDFLAGTDTKERVGPTRVLAAGLVSVKEMKIAITLVFGVTFLCGLYLVYLGGWVILLIGILSILSGIAYTAGPYPLAYNGLGDIFVFVFFGLVGTAGAYYVQSLHFTTLSILTAIPVGALITNILIVNNYRDIEQDKANGKNTLAVLFGRKFSQVQYSAFLIISYIVPVLVYIFFRQSVFVFLPILSLPLSVKLVKMIYTYDGAQLNETLELTAKLSGIYGILFSAGLIL